MQLKMSQLFYYSVVCLVVWYASTPYTPRHPDQRHPRLASCRNCVHGASMTLIISVCIATSGWEVPKGSHSSLQ